MNETTTATSPEAPLPSCFSPGAWFSMDYAFHRLDFYVVRVQDRLIALSRPGWLVSTPIWMTARAMQCDFHKAVYLGHGRRKAYWRFLPWRDLVCPYHPPKTNPL